MIVASDSGPGFDKAELLDPWPARSAPTANSADSLTHTDSLATTVARASASDGLDVALLNPWASSKRNDYQVIEIIDPWARTN